MAIGEELKKWRRELHQIPEIGYQEKVTSQYLYQELTAMGYQPHQVVNTGWYVYIDNGQAESIAFRSDIDALAISELNEISFKSKHQGTMHACGHDGHMSALLGLAKMLQENKQLDYPYNIVLVFQPAEEIEGGATSIIASGIFERYNVKAIFGMHLMPSVDQGVIGCRKGPLMAESGELDLVVTGKESHAGLPEKGIDAIAITNLILNQYQAMIPRTTSPFDPCIINIGTIQGGTARNIVAGSCQAHGTVRAYSEEVFNELVRKMKQINKG